MSEQESQRNDLGFGKVAASRTTKRLINRDGSFNVRRSGLSYWKSAGFYQALLSMGWGRFLLLALAGYLCLNLVFALGYFFLEFEIDALRGEEAGGFGQFLRCFYFSVQTSSTIGFGHIVPIGLAANLIVTLESFVGLLGVALITGLAFARFSRPQAHVLFSQNALIAPYGDQQRAFMFRIVNGRSNQLLELHAQLSFSWLVGTSREFYPLPLERDRVPFFSLNWTIVHPIDAQSPLAGVTLADLVERQAEITVLLMALDETFAQTVHARSSYRAEEIIFGARFVPMFYSDEQHGIVLEIDKLSEFEPATLA